MQKKPTSHSAFFNPHVLIALLFCAAVVCSILNVPLLGFSQPKAPSNVPDRTLTIAERVAYQRAIEEVHWRHRIWPRERPDPKPSLDAVMSEAQLENKVAGYLRDSLVLEDYWRKPIMNEQLQAEMDRMARDTKQPKVLRELFEALGNDPAVIAECLARPILAERLIANLSVQDKTRRFEPTRTDGLRTIPLATTLGQVGYSLPKIADAGDPPCTDDTWTDTSFVNAFARDSHTAVWTGSEMIVWGGYNGSCLNTGGRYDPATDSWMATSNTNAPSARDQHTAVWTGSEMIVWGGRDETFQPLNTGGRYDPNTDSWAATSTTNAPDARLGHTPVWTGSEMIVWGGTPDTFAVFNTGGRYNPGTDSWTATSTTNVPDARYLHTAVWSGSEMIVWGGTNGGPDFNTGGKYNPSTNSWTPTSITNVPSVRFAHTAVWIGSEMIVWGGVSDAGWLNTGGRYNPATESWMATTTTNAPSARDYHTAVWTGSEMIVWGGHGCGGGCFFDTGGRYNAASDSWTATSTSNVPDARYLHTAVWTGSEMIVWGGTPDSITYFNTGGRYCAQTSPPPTPTPTPTPTATPTATPTVTPNPSATPRPRPTPRHMPSPRLRPTPAPRPSP
jgi:N-acetylneuraminic acid mutarotase